MTKDTEQPFSYCQGSIPGTATLENILTLATEGEDTQSLRHNNSNEEPQQKCGHMNSSHWHDFS